MKLNFKMKFLCFLLTFLLLFQNSSQTLSFLRYKSNLRLLLKSKTQAIKINDPLLTNSNDVMVPNAKFDINSAKVAKSSREFVRQIIGEPSWEKIQTCLQQLGKKWQEKINTLFDSIPLELREKAKDNIDPTEISQTLESIKSLKAEADARMKEIYDYPEDHSKKVIEDNPDIYGFILDHIESEYNIDILYTTKSTSSELMNMLKAAEVGDKGKRIVEKDLDELIKKYALKSSQVEKNPRFEQVDSTSSFDFMKVVSNLGQDELFVPKYVDPDRDDPAPNVEEGGANCWDTGSCKIYGLITMKCTLMRIIMRIIYEIICGIVNIFGLVITGLCACVLQKEPPYYEGQAEMSCNNRSSWPGLICMIPYGLFVALYSFTFALWKLIWGLTQICKVPIGSIEIASPP